MLTHRQVEVLELLAEGLDYSKIASRLVVSPSTIKGLIRDMYTRLEVHSAAHAVHKAHLLGILGSNGRWIH